MDKLLKFLKNKWFLLGISFLSFIYVFFLAKVAQLVFTCYLETENMATLTIMYVFEYGGTSMATKKIIKID